MDTNFIVAVLIGLGVGAAAGYIARQILSSKLTTQGERKAAQKLRHAEQEAKEIVLKAKDKSVSLLEEYKKEESQRQKQLARHEDRLDTREEKLEKQQTHLDTETEKLREAVAKVKEAKTGVEKIKEEQYEELQKVSKLSEEDAQKRLLDQIEGDYQDLLKERIRKMEAFAKDELEKRAADVMAQAMQRYASGQAEEQTTSTVQLPSEEVKGRIIGKEGRNIKAFQEATGVEVIIDDTPDTVILSCFSPLRRQVAKVSLERLIKDGRIQPTRIEEIVSKVKEEFSDKIKQLGQDAVYELGIHDFDPKLVNLIGMMHFRTSYGQNLLRHSVEMAHLAAMIASELGADIVLTKKAALLHDIGKALSHEVEGSHTEIGAKIMKKFGISGDIIEAAESHHEEHPFTSVESRIIQVTDAISASRPGARKESYENYIKRLEELEGVANRFDHVQKTYAIQAGREVRIFVDADNLNDTGAHRLAKDIAGQIQEELTYPGEIKVNVIREKRVVEFAR